MNEEIRAYILQNKKTGDIIYEPINESNAIRSTRFRPLFFEQGISDSNFVMFEEKQKKSWLAKIFNVSPGMPKWTWSNRPVIKAKKKGYYHKFVDYNLWTFRQYKIPKEWRKKVVNKRQIENYTSPEKTLAKPRKHHLKGQHYFVHDNGGKPFLAVIDKKSIHVFTKNQDTTKYIWDDRNLMFHATGRKGDLSFTSLFDAKDERGWYTNLVFKCENAKKIWIGKSPKTRTTKFSGGHGKEFDGNSILVQCSTRKYVCIESQIYSFESPQIISYTSPVGNNDVPYPVAETEKRYLFMLDWIWVNKKDFKITGDDLYYDFFGHGGENKDAKIHHSFANVK